jgi:hypothetical protein
MRALAVFAIAVLLANSHCFARCLTFACQHDQQQCAACKHSSPSKPAGSPGGCAHSYVDNTSFEVVSSPAITPSISSLCLLHGPSVAVAFATPYSPHPRPDPAPLVLRI